MFASRLRITEGRADQRGEFPRFLTSVSEKAKKIGDIFLQKFQNTALSEQELLTLYEQTKKTANELKKKEVIKSYAETTGIVYEQILQDLRLYARNQILQKEKGNIRHFHRTNISNLKSILEMGQLLPRSVLEDKFPNIEIPIRSSSYDVMMTRDMFNSNGDLIKPGFLPGNMIDIFSDPSVFIVLKEKVMMLETYDATTRFPTSQDISLKKYCEIILVEREEDLDKIKKMVSQNQYSIPVVLKNNWKR